MFRQRSLLVLVLLCSVLMISTAVSAQQAPPSEPTPQLQGQPTTPGEGKVRINFLNSGEPVDEVLPEGVAALLFGFDASANDVVTITMNKITEDFDPFIVLLGPRGEVIAYDDDSGGDFNSEISDVTLPTNGSYIIIASSFYGIDSIIDSDSDAQARDFTIEVTGNNPPVDDPNYNPDRALIFTGNVEVGGSTQGVLNAQEPVYYYFLETTAGQNLDIETYDTDVDTLLMVFDQNGSRIAFNDDDDTDGDNLTAGIYDLPITEDGFVMIMVTVYNFYSSGSEMSEGTFTMSVSE